MTADDTVTAHEGGFCHQCQSAGECQARTPCDGVSHLAGDTCSWCGPTALKRTMPLLDGTPVLMCMGCQRIDTEQTWRSR